MKGRIKWAVLSALLFALCMGCCPCRHLAGTDTHTESNTTDTTVTPREIRIHDTIFVPIPAQSASSVGETDTNGLPCSHLETDFAVSDAFVDSVGKLHHTLENKPQNLPAVVDTTVHAYDTTITNTQTTSDTHTDYVEVEKPLEWWQTFLMWTGGVALIVALVFLVWRLARLYFRKLGG